MVSYAPGYLKGGIVRLISPYMGETFDTLDEARAYAKEEELDRYMEIKYYMISELPAESGEKTGLGRFLKNSRKLAYWPDRTENPNG